MKEPHRAGLTGETIDLFDGDRDALAEYATRLWEMREKMFPERVRRMKPDALDMATGAWGVCVREAMNQMDPKRWGFNSHDDADWDHRTVNTKTSFFNPTR